MWSTDASSESALAPTIRRASLPTSWFAGRFLATPFKCLIQVSEVVRSSRAALSELQIRRGGEAGSQIFGVDVDPIAFVHAQRLTAAGVPRKNLTRGSFLSGDVYQRLPRIDVVVGNP